MLRLEIIPHVGGTRLPRPTQLFREFFWPHYFAANTLIARNRHSLPVRTAASGEFLRCEITKLGVAVIISGSRMEARLHVAPRAARTKLMAAKTTSGTAVSLMITKCVDDPWLAKLSVQGGLALAEVFNEHYDRLCRIVSLRMDTRLRQRVDVADIMQETFLRAWKRLPRYLDDPEVPVFVWLRGVALDTLIHVHRYHLGARMRDAGREISLDGRLQREESSTLVAAWLRGGANSPSHAAMKEEAARIVQDSLAQMADIDRQVLFLRHFEHLTNDEVASIIGVKKAAASRRYMRALVHLGEAIRGVVDLDD